jgi:hypothetical protein
MGAEQEVTVLWGPDGGNPNRRDKGAVRAREQVCPRGGVWWKSKVECQTERKQSAEQAPVTEGELASGSGPVSVGTVRGSGAGVGTKFCVLTRGGLWAPAFGR